LGANAVHGVINITPKAQKTRQGLLVSGGGGSLIHDLVKSGMRSSASTRLSAYVKHFDATAHASDGSNAGDGWQMTKALPDRLDRSRHNASRFRECLRRLHGQPNARDVSVDRRQRGRPLDKKFSEASN